MAILLSFFFNGTSTTEIYTRPYTLSLHDALPITTPLAPTAPEVDGPCFHAARGALDTAKRDRLVFAFGGFEPAVVAFAGYYSALYWSWTRRQRQAASYLRYYADTLGSLKLAQSMDIHPTGLSHLRRRMAWPLVEAGDKMFRDAIAPGEGS